MELEQVQEPYLLRAKGGRPMDPALVDELVRRVAYLEQCLREGTVCRPS